MITLGEIVLIHDLKRQGLSVTAIARQLGIDRKTVRKHLIAGLAAPSYAPRPAQPRLIAPYEDYLRARIATWPDLSGKRLLRELRERGYAYFADRGRRFHAISGACFTSSRAAISRDRGRG